MTNAQAIKYLSALPPGDVAPMSYQFAPSGRQGSPKIAMGRIVIAIDPEGKVTDGSSFYIGQDAVITVDGQPLDIGLIEEARIVLRHNRPVVLELAVVPQPGRSSNGSS